MDTYFLRYWYDGGYTTLTKGSRNTSKFDEEILIDTSGTYKDKLDKEDFDMSRKGYEYNEITALAGDSSIEKAFQNVLKYILENPDFVKRK
mgnify:CR=1 FL=1|jgi:hypothetical protein